MVVAKEKKKQSQITNKQSPFLLKAKTKQLWVRKEKKVKILSWGRNANK